MVGYVIPLTEADSYLLLERLRWDDGKPDACPHCDSTARFYFLAPKDGTPGRKTRTGANSQRRVWKCAACRKQFSVLTGTIFEGTKISLRTWLAVIHEFASPDAVSAWKIARKYEITPESAWHMLHRIRAGLDVSRRNPTRRKQANDTAVILLLC